ncbi:MAG: hypothetical protein ACREJ6_07595, partial [Candidatus Methylomirabilis sp.]
MGYARALLLFLALTVGVVCGGGVSVASATAPPFLIAQDLAGLVQAAELVVVGKVIEMKPGRIAGEGDARLQFNDIRVTVEKRLKGEPTGTVTVEQVDMTGRFFLSGVGPAYNVGERYVLFLRPGEGDRHFPLTQGRYLLARGSVRPTEEGPAADKVKD